MYLYNGDKCTVGQHIIARHHHHPAEIHPSPTFIARVVEIIQQVGSPAYMQSQPDGILLQTVNSSAPNAKYQMPRLFLQDKWSFVRPQVSFWSFKLTYNVNLTLAQDILCTVNAQHDCHRNQCSTTGFWYVYQERVQTQTKYSTMEHTQNPDDLVLNTAQMRDTVHVQHYRIDSEPLDTNSVIQEGAARVIDARKTADSMSNETAMHGGRGHGRGRGRARGARGLTQTQNAHAEGRPGRGGSLLT